MAEFLQGVTAVETSLYGCPDPTAGRAIILNATGEATSACHQLRDNQGQPISLQGLASSPIEQLLGEGRSVVIGSGDGLPVLDNLHDGQMFLMFGNADPSLDGWYIVRGTVDKYWEQVSAGQAPVTTTTTSTSTSSTSTSSTTTADPLLSAPANALTFETQLLTLEEQLLTFGTTTALPNVFQFFSPTTTTCPPPPVTTTTAPPLVATTTSAPTSLCSTIQSAKSVVLFSCVMCPSHTPIVGPLVISDASNGRVCFPIPADVARNPGIYTAEIWIADAAGQPYVKDSVLISIEATLAARSLMSGSIHAGPLTIGQIRLRLRDWAIENTAFDAVEFKDAEILEAILEPIRFWNETPPVNVSYNASNFPMHSLWLTGATATLLEIAAIAQMRNARNITYGDGKVSDDRDKHAQYLQLAQLKLTDFRRRVIQAKVAINWGASPSSLGGTVMG